MDSLDLIKQLRKGDLSAKEELVKINTGLVWSVVRRFTGRGCEPEDLYQLGMLGLIKAIDRFDLELGLQFSTYAVPIIQGEIKRFLRDDGMIKVSRIIKTNAMKLYRAKETIELQKGRDATLEEMAEAVGIEAYEAAEALTACADVESLYKTIYDNEGSDIYLIDKTGEGGEFDKELVDRLAVQKLLATLNARDSFIIRKRYFEEKTQSWIAGRLKISQVQVSRIEKKILAELKRKLL